MTITGWITRKSHFVAAAAFAAVLGFTAMTQARPANADFAAPQSVAFMAMPDLLVSSAQFKNDPSGALLVFTVKNAGISAHAFIVQVEAHNGAVLQSFTVSGLSTGASQTFTHKLPDCVPYGMLSRTIRVDVGNLIAESNENNNAVTKNFIYGPLC